MGLREDLEAMRQHQARGTLKQYMDGTLSEEQRQRVREDGQRMPEDQSASLSMNSPAWMAARGD